MASSGFSVLVAIDGSRASEAAVETVVRFPWPEGSRLHGVVALRSGSFGVRSRKMDEAMKKVLQDAAASARDALASRWSRAQVAVLDKAPSEAILGEAKRLRADVIALGWREQGTFRRLFAGSVSRTVAARAACSILVARKAPATVRRFVVGYDDEPNARRAVRLLGRLQSERNMHASLVNVVEKIALPARASRLPASLRTTLRSHMAVLNDERRKDAETAVKAAAERLKRDGWRVDADIRAGAPLAGLSNALRAYRGDVLVVGAPESVGLERALVGSVAHDALLHPTTPVLIVR